MFLLDRALYWLEYQLRRWNQVPHRNTDACVFVASFPKSGNTWVRFILANISRIMGGHEEEVDFYTLVRYSPWVARDRNLSAVIRTPGMPLFLKTHFPYVPAFDAYRPVLIVRHPIDVMAAYHHHRFNGLGLGPGRLQRFVRHWRYGVSAWCNFHRRWLGHEYILVRYEDLLTDTLGQVRRLVDALDLHVPQDVLVEAVRRSSRESMRHLERERGRRRRKRPGFMFVGDGGTSQGRQELSPADQSYVRRTCGSLLEVLGYADAAEGSPAETSASGDSP